MGGGEWGIKRKGDRMRRKQREGKSEERERAGEWERKRGKDGKKRVIWTLWGMCLIQSCLYFPSLLSPNFIKSLDTVENRDTARRYHLSQRCPSQRCHIWVRCCLLSQSLVSKPGCHLTVLTIWLAVMPPWLRAQADSTVHFSSFCIILGLQNYQ